MKNKQEIRKQILQIRNALDPAQKERLSMAIQKHLLALPVYKNSHSIMVYLNTQHEVQTMLIAEQTLEMGKRLIVPHCGSGEIIPCEITDLKKDLTIGTFGILEPCPECLQAVDPQEIELVLIPGVAFDAQGNRIGLGKGFYDRFLPKLKTEACLAGLAYSFQIIESFEIEAHDQKVSLLISENGVIYPG
jgi:5-formyltetrahydrofolate cyclo-ligase